MLSKPFLKNGLLSLFIFTIVCFYSLATIAQNVGIGTTTPQAKLDVNGQIRMSGGSPGAGKVLTSDATGIGSWMEATMHADAANFTGNGTTALPLKLAQMGASAGQVLKWNGTTWAAAADATGGSSGWTDDGSIIRLTNTTDSVRLGSVSLLGKFNVGGNIGLNELSSIYFGSEASRISGMTGGDLRIVTEDLSVLTTEDISFGHYGDETWIKFDNANKRVGIGTLVPADKLHVVQNTTTAGSIAIKGVSTPTTGLNYGIYGESLSASGYGMYGESPKYGVYGNATGNQGRGVVGEATGTASIGVQGIAVNTSSTGVWGEGSNQGVYGFSSSTTGKGVYGKVTSASGYSGYFEGGHFYVKGSAEVKDTLYANVVNASKINIMPGLANSIEGSFSSGTALGTSWTELNSVTVTVPAPGYVLLIASCTMIANHDYGDVAYVHMGVSKNPDGTEVKEIIGWAVSSFSPSASITEVLSAQAAMQVTAAGSVTFYLMGYRGGTDTVLGRQCNLTALYIPVAYGIVE